MEKGDTALIAPSEALDTAEPEASPCTFQFHNIFAATKTILTVMMREQEWQLCCICC